MNNEGVFKTFLQVAVWMEVNRIQRRGGPTDLDWEWLESNKDRMAEQLGTYGDHLVHRCEGQPGKAGELAGLVARFLAISFFLPGGERRVTEFLNVDGSLW